MNPQPTAIQVQSVANAEPVAQTPDADKEASWLTKRLGIHEDDKPAAIALGICTLGIAAAGCTPVGFAFLMLTGAVAATAAAVYGTLVLGPVVAISAISLGLGAYDKNSKVSVGLKLKPPSLCSGGLVAAATDVASSPFSLAA